MMSRTGIIRRIDDLGRIVIPREIRRTLHISEGDPLEFFVDGDTICLKRYYAEIELSKAVKSIQRDIEDLAQNQDADVRAVWLEAAGLLEDACKILNESEKGLQ